MTTEARYRTWSPRSAEFMARASEVFPGGDTRASAHYWPYPLVIESARGATLTDRDGHQLIDFMNNFTSLVHGHAHPAVVEAVQRQVGLGSAYAAPSQEQVELAELIKQRVASIEQLRFCSSGTEATQMAIRCARAATGRQKIMKMEGGYHGSYEQAEVSLAPHPKDRGPIAAPHATPIDPSIPQSALDDTIICPFNQAELARELINEHASELAAVIIEPMLGSMGMVPATQNFLQALRAATAEHGIVLIFDEVITLRLAQGGAQSQYDVTPDLTAMGKIIGGGLPIGAVGGREELMQLFSPGHANNVFHASTFSGNALSMAAGLAAMTAFTEDENIRINHLGDTLRDGFNHVFAQAGIRGQALGRGSLVNILFTDNAIEDARGSIDSMLQAGNLTRLLHLEMLMHGIASASRLMYCVSTAMNEKHIDKAITALNNSLTILRPHIEAHHPEVLV